MSRVIPHDLELERAVIGAVILDNRLGSVVCGEVDLSCFYDPRNRVIFNAISQLVEVSEPVDAVTIHGRLSEPAKAAEGMVYYLSTLTDAVATLQRVESYIAKIKEVGKRRQLIESFSSLADLGYSESVPTDEFFQEARRSVTEITDGGDNTKSLTIKDASTPVYDEILSGKKPEGLIKTGIDAIDSVYGGLWPGATTMLAARPSMGKTALALTIAVNAAFYGKKVMYFGCEDPNRSAIMRIFARLADVNLRKIRQRNLSLDEVDRIKRKKAIIDCLPLTLSDLSNYTPQSLRGTLQRKIDTDGLDLFIFDHLTYIKGEGSNRYEKITDSIERLAQVVKDLDIANLVLHQLNRENVKRENKMPTLSDLRGSGDIEQVCRAIWFIHREHYYDPEAASENDATLIVAKDSDGGTGSVGLHCDLSRMVFADKEDRF